MDRLLSRHRPRASRTRHNVYAVILTKTALVTSEMFLICLPHQKDEAAVYNCIISHYKKARNQ